MRWSNNLGQASGIGCIVQLVILILWGMLGDWMIGIFLDMLVGEYNHGWQEVNSFVSWLAGVFLGKFALLGILIGAIVGAIIGFPLI